MGLWEEKRSHARRQAGGRAPFAKSPPFCFCPYHADGCLCVWWCVRKEHGRPASQRFCWLLLLLLISTIAIAIASSYLLVGLLLGGLLGGDRLLRAALLEHRLRDDGLGLAAHHGRHGC